MRVSCVSFCIEGKLELHSMAVSGVPCKHTHSCRSKATGTACRYGVGAVIPGLDAGLKTMKVGGIRRLYIPGDMAFPKGLSAAAGRPRVPPNSPVVFDVELLYIPGFEVDEDD
jgi:hypothetical protein